MEILNKVTDIIKEKMTLSDEMQINPDTSVEELNLDSMDLVEIVMEIENEFDITVPEGAEEKLHTVGDVVQLIEKLI